MSTRKILVAVLAGTAMWLAVPAPPASAWVDSELRFVDEVRAVGISDKGVASLVDLGNNICRQLLTHSPEAVANAAFEGVSPHMSYSQVATVVNAANRNLCPGY